MKSMIAEEFQEAFHKWWGDISFKVNKALVFLDSPAAESLHWNGGLRKLLNASNVKAFSPFERGEKTEKKAVFVITSLLLEEQLHTLQAIVQASSFAYCIVITTIPEHVYSQHPHSGVEREHFFHSVETKLLNWMGSQSYTAEILCIPVAGMRVCSNFFLLPAFHDVFPHLSDSSLESMNTSEWKNRGILEKTLPLEKDMEIKALAHTLNSLFEHMHVKEDIFSIGHLSSMLGSELESLNSARNRRKTASRKVSLVLVNRTLDLAGVLTQNCESMLDKVIRVLPHLPDHTCDVAIDMSPLCASDGGKVFGISLLAPGCLADDNDPKRTLLTTFISKKQKDCMMTINRHLVEKASVGLSLETGCHVRRVTPEQLQKQVLTFRNSPESWEENIGLLQYALAVVQTLQHPENNILDEIQSTEQLLIQNLAASAENVLQNLIYLLSNRKERSLSLVTIITLLAYLYALEDETNFLSILDEQKLQAALVEAIFQDSHDLPPFLLELIGDSVEENNVISTVNMIFRQLKCLSMARRSMKRYKSVFHCGDIAHPASYAPLLKQLLEDIFNTSHTDLPDLEYHSAGIKDYLKSSFSLFMNITKPHPRDNPTVIVLVLGGITATEVNQIREIGEKSSSEVIVGSTMLVTPYDIIKKIFRPTGSGR